MEKDEKDSKRTVRRRWMFRLYAANLALHRPEDAGYFSCPICGTLHQECAVEPATLGVNLAHIWPKGCGGKQETLTCESCNSNLGRICDFSLVENSRLWSALGPNPETTVDGTLTMGDYKMGVEYGRKKEGGYRINHIPKRTNKTHLDAIKNQIASGEEVKFTVSVKGIDLPRHALAYLHSAYLALFRQFGYEYVIHADSEWVRDILRSPTDGKKVKIRWMRIAQGAIQEPLKDLLFRVNIVQTGDGLRCLGVNLPAFDPANPIMMIQMPGFGDSGRNDFHNLLQQPTATGEVGLLGTDFFPPDQRLGDGNFITHGRDLWEAAFKDATGTGYRPPIS